LKLLQKPDSNFRLAVLLLRQIYLIVDDVARVETRIDALQSQPGFSLTSRATPEAHSNRSFENHHKLRVTVTLATLPLRPPSFKGFTEIHSHRLQGGKPDEQDPVTTEVQRAERTGDVERRSSPVHFRILCRPREIQTTYTLCPIGEQ